MTIKESPSPREESLHGAQLAVPSQTMLGCEDCGKVIRESGALTAYFVQFPTLMARRAVACYCLSCAPISFTREFLIETRPQAHHLLVDGRLGLAQDSARQETWPILVSPAISAETRRAGSGDPDEEPRLDSRLTFDTDGWFSEVKHS